MIASSAVGITKKLMRDVAALMSRMQAEETHFTAELKSPEAHEAFAAFAEKRPPDFTRLQRS